MVWTTQEDLENARTNEPLFSPDSLFAKAKDAGIDGNPGAELLNNTNFLTKLVTENKIGEEEKNNILATVAAGRQPNQQFLDELLPVLMFSSQPETYAYKDIARRLIRGPLARSETAERRVNDTAVIIMEIMDGLDNGDGTGLHRAFRLGTFHQELNPNAEERLINQVSLAFTLLTFSFTPFEAMKRVAPNEDVPPEHREAWLKMWNVVGSLMGIGCNGLPETVAEAEALTKLIRTPSDLYGRTEEGMQLITALIEAKGDDTRDFFRYGGEELMGILGVQQLPPV